MRAVDLIGVAAGALAAGRRAVPVADLAARACAIRRERRRRCGASRRGSGFRWPRGSRRRSRSGRRPVRGSRRCWRASGRSRSAVWQPPWAQDLSQAGVRVFLGVGWQVVQCPVWIVVRSGEAWQSAHATGPKLWPEMVTVCEAGSAVCDASWLGCGLAVWHVVQSALVGMPSAWQTRHERRATPPTVVSALAWMTERSVPVWQPGAEAARVGGQRGVGRGARAVDLLRGAGAVAAGLRAGLVPCVQSACRAEPGDTQRNPSRTTTRSAWRARSGCRSGGTGRR